MPDELFDKWLAPLIESQGWPFASIHDDIDSSHWKYYLGSEYTLEEWSQCTWELITIPFNVFNIYDSTRRTIQDIIISAVKDIETSVANLERTKERFWACASFYRKHGTIPFPVVVYQDFGFFRLIDGFHRIASVIHVGYSNDFTIPAWLAKLMIISDY